MQTNNAHEYTEAQLQAAIDAAFPAGKRTEGFNLDTYPRGTPYWAEEAPNRLAIARAFLAALPKPDHCVEADQKADPWTLPAPPPGRRWHREDWTADMLPEGYRPLLEGEAWLRGDEIRRTGSTRWDVAGQIGFDVIGEPTTKKTSHTRTRRPLPAEASAEPEQTEEKPCGLNSALLDWPSADDGPPWQPHAGGPCPLKDEEVEEWEYKMRSGQVKHDMPDERPSYRRWKHEDFSTDIIAYRVIKWKSGHGPQAASKADEPAPAPAAPTEAAEAEKGPSVQTFHGVIDLPENVSWEDYDQALRAQAERWRKHLAKEQEKRKAVEAKLAELQASQPEPARHGWPMDDLLKSMEPKPPAQPWTPKPGDVVRLKSGGPEMTLVAPSKEFAGLWETVWVSNEGFAQGFKLPAACLTPAKEGQP